MSETMDNIRQVIRDTYEPLVVRIKNLEDDMVAATQYRIDCQKETYGRIVELEKAKSEQNGINRMQEGISRNYMTFVFVTLGILQVIVGAIVLFK